ncbi:MAG: lipopolysaccharide biosynthesis protein [Porticoccus sp.]|nr:lipopolysaccharide biosynthesis protein [Porticoccus sp.]
MTTRTAIAFSITGRYIMLVLQFISTMILARLLTPEDIGIYSAGFSLVALSHLFRDFGLNQYIIQEKELDEAKIQTTFTLSLIISWSLGTLLYFMSGVAADFFNEEGIHVLVQLLSISFFLIPFGSITLAILRKNLRFHITSGISLIATLLGIIVAVWTAYHGAQYFCLAYGAITETASIVFLSCFFRPKGMKFGLSLHGARHIFRFGSIVGLGNIVTQFSTSATDALIARLLGLSALGFFSRALGTFSLFDNIFVSSIRPTILPLLSRDNNDLTKLTDGYLKTVSYSFIFAWPFFTFLFLYTQEVIQVLYGTQWDTAIPLVKILCAAGILLPPILFADNLFIAYGRPDITLKIRIISNLAKLAMVVVASFFGLEAICIAFVGFFVIKLFTSLIYIEQILAINLTKLFTLAAQAVVPLLFTIIPTVIANITVQPFTPGLLFHFILLMFTAFIGWLVGLAISNHPFFSEIKLLYNRFAPSRTT